MTRFINKFDEDHGVLHPTFYQGTYSQVTLLLHLPAGHQSLVKTRHRKRGHWLKLSA